MAGRPPWIPTPEIIQEVERLSGLGLNQEQIADCLGIHIDTVCVKKHEYPEFADAFKKGKAKGIARVTEKLTKQMDDGNASAAIFWLKCNAGWKEAREELDNKITSLLQSVIDKL